MPTNFVTTDGPCKSEPALEPPVHHESITNTLCKAMQDTEDWETIGILWSTICHVRAMTGRPY